jgi:hypothetical protein
MKKHRDADELAKQLTTAVSTPLQTIPANVEHPPKDDVSQASKKKKSDAVPVFLRLPAEMHKRFEEIAIARTKETGRGTSVQQIILEQLELN